MTATVPIHAGLGRLPAGLPVTMTLPPEQRGTVLRGLVLRWAPQDVYVAWSIGTMYGIDPTREDLYVDLSRPVDGDRLDAIGWALGVLGRACGAPAGSEITATLLRIGCLEVLTLRWPGGVASICRRDGSESYREGYGPTAIVLDPWPDLTGLSDDDATRAVLAAALGPGGMVGP